VQDNPDPLLAVTIGNKEPEISSAAQLSAPAPEISLAETSLMDADTLLQ